MYDYTGNLRIEEQNFSNGPKSYINIGPGKTPSSSGHCEFWTWLTGFALTV